MTLRETVNGLNNVSPATLLAADYLDRILKITKIEPYLFTGDISNSTLDTFTGGIVYLGIEVIVGGQQTIQTTSGAVNIYDHINSNAAGFGTKVGFFEGSLNAVRYVLNNVYFNNLIFGRIALNTWDDIKFIGYKITHTP
jgi:hypothetical protein